MKRMIQRSLTLLLSVFLLIQPVCASDTSDKPKAQILLEMNSGKVLLEENADERLPMASITKLMGLILIGEALENGELSLDEMLTCSEYAQTMGGSEIWLKAGEQMSVDHLLKAVMIASANDAIVVFAERLGATEYGFVQLMNQRAAELGLNDTHFSNSTGFDEENHYTSARDVAKMAQELQKYPEVLTYARVWMDSLRDGETMLVNTNRLVRFYQGTTGLKTGTTDAAGYCLCATAERNDLKLCSVVLGCRTSEGRFEAAKAMLDYGFSKYCVYRPDPIELKPMAVSHGTKEWAELQVELPEAVVLLREDVQNVTMDIPELAEKKAPLESGEEVGRVCLLSGEKELTSYPIVVKEAVEELNFKKCFELLLKASVSVGKNSN